MINGFNNQWELLARYFGLWGQLPAYVAFEHSPFDHDCAMPSQLDADSLLQCLEQYIEANGGWQCRNALLVRSGLAKRLYPCMYRHVTLVSSRSLYRLKRTLDECPDYIHYIHMLWVRVGRDNIPYPAIKDATYPRRYHRYRNLLSSVTNINKFDVMELGRTIQMMSPVLTRLTICARLYYPQLRSALQNMHFPNVLELEAPVELVSSPDSDSIFAWLSSGCPNLLRLRLMYCAEKEGVVEILDRHDLSCLTKLTHLYVSYWAEYRDMVEDSLVNLRVSQSVQVVALELDSAVHVPICPSRLCFYKAHPKVVFVMKQGVYSEMMSTLSWTHEMELVQELCVMFDMKEVDRLYLWDVVEKKVSERWNNFLTGVRSQMAWMGQGNEVITRCSEW